jgi:hypothetical protein
MYGYWVHKFQTYIDRPWFNNEINILQCFHSLYCLHLWPDTIAEKRRVLMAMPRVISWNRRLTVWPHSVILMWASLLAGFPINHHWCMPASIFTSLYCRTYFFGYRIMTILDLYLKSIFSSLSNSLGIYVLQLDLFTSQLSLPNKLFKHLNVYRNQDPAKPKF